MSIELDEERLLRADSVRAERPASTHPLTRDAPLVEEDGIRCYAGVPLITSEGHAIGTVCAIGTVPRPFPEEDLAILQELAAEAMARIEARRRK